MTYTIDSKPLWQPNPNTVSDTPMAIFMQAMGHGRYDDLWQWSVDQPEAFWSKLWDFCGVVGEKGNEILVDRNKMTDVHLSLLVKIVRSCTETQFTEHFEKQDFPKVRLGPAEAKIKELIG